MHGHKRESGVRIRGHVMRTKFNHLLMNMYKQIKRYIALKYQNARFDNKIQDKASKPMQYYAMQTTQKYVNTTYTATPLLFHPPGPLHAYTHKPMATHTLIDMAQNVGA
jgi:hypothetical protein